MIKTLQITSIILAALAIFVLSILFVFTAKSDPTIKELLSSDLSGKSKSTAQNVKNQAGSQVFPLVQQAQTFALYLKPPTSKIAATERPAADTGKKSVIPAADVTPKFKLLATIYYSKNPGLSQAFISEPGSNPRWVKQSTTVGHFIIEQVQNGIIIVNNGHETFELKKEQTPSIILPVKSPAKAGITVSGKPDIPVQPVPQPQPSQAKTETQPSASASTPSQITSFESTGSPGLDLIIKQYQQSVDAGDKEKAQQLEGIYARIKAAQAAQLNKQETEIIDNLGKTKEDKPDDMNSTDEK